MAQSSPLRVVGRRLLQAAPVIVQLPVDAYAALRTAWSLPVLPAAR